MMREISMHGTVGTDICRLLSAAAHFMTWTSWFKTSVLSWFIMMECGNLRYCAIKGNERRNFRRELVQRFMWWYFHTIFRSEFASNQSKCVQNKSAHDILEQFFPRKKPNRETTLRVRIVFYLKALTILQVIKCLSLSSTAARMIFPTVRNQHIYNSILFLVARSSRLVPSCTYFVQAMSKSQLRFETFLRAEFKAHIINTESSFRRKNQRNVS